ncbi:helix-hairpin-helix domain-containing protein [Kocuria arenosa]|uniref:helix-hairpin-helix domain-containing protein n=1 Tax=Kocuria arenosa TaxID=3071446 RepID=UPI0034D3FC4B
MTGTVPRARRRAISIPPATSIPPAPPAPAAEGVPGGAAAPGVPPSAERLAALLAEARAEPIVPGTVPSPADQPSGPVPAHRRQVAARTRVPASLLLIGLAALAWPAWTVLGPGEDGGGAPETAGRPVLAEAELGGDTERGTAPGAEPGTGHDTDHDTGDGDLSGADAGAETGPGTVPPGPPTAPTPSAGPTLYVHVTGEVARPGVVSVENGARVVDAVEAAGGLTEAAVTDTVNLAAPVTDGQQVLVPDSETAPVPAPGAPVAPGTPGAGTSGAPPGTEGPDGAVPGGTLNLNTATAAELDTLPRVGPVLAGRIVEFRQEHGGFAAVADLDAVPGIGPALMEALGPLVTV